MEKIKLFDTGAYFYDPKTGQVFVSTYECVRRAAEKVNKVLRDEEDYYVHALSITDTIHGTTCPIKF